MGYETVKSVEKAISILELLTAQTLDSQPLTLAEIARATGILPVTARNLLRTLEACGYACRTSHGHYREGERCYKLFRHEGVLRQLREVGEPFLRKTVDDLGESLLLVAIVKNKRVELLRCQAPDDPLQAPQWSANADFYQMRTTRAILAWYPPRQRDAFIETCGLPPLKDWPESEGTAAGMRRELEKIRRDGGCMDEHGSYVAMAVPILTAGNEVMASLGCYALRSRTDKPRAAGIFKMLQDCAQALQEQMGI